MRVTIGSREYELLVPEGQGPFPVIIGLHGGSGVISHFDEKTGLGDAGVSRGYVVLIPQGINGAWSVGGHTTTAAAANAADIKFLFDIVDDASKQVPINSNALFLVGHSNGAGFAYSLAAQYPERVTGVGIYAGSLGGNVPTGPVNVLHIHGTNDTNVQYDGGIGPNSGQVNPPVSETMEKWVAPLTLPVKTTTTLNSFVVEDRWEDPTHTVVLWSVIGGTHAWPTFVTGAILDFFDTLLTQEVPPKELALTGTSESTVLFVGLGLLLLTFMVFKR